MPSAFPAPFRRLFRRPFRETDQPLAQSVRPARPSAAERDRGSFRRWSAWRRGAGSNAALPLRLAALALAAVALSGCYYIQAARGQYEVLSRRVPIEELVADADTPPGLRRRLELVSEARRFAIAELGLPDNGSYTSYADLERDYVVWNVFAAPEFSLEPRRWCYPVVGCAAYRGYFSEQRANAEARRLSEEGYDTLVAGVPAYSTLGRFEDPVLNTMLGWDDATLVATLFHELAHQVLYVKGDTVFNESFATVVEEEGLARWLEARDESAPMERRERRARTQRALLERVEDARAELARIYAADLDAAEKRRRKRAVFAALEVALAELPGTARWLAPPLDNASLVPLTLYTGLVPALRAVLDQCGGELECFYGEVRALAELDEPERREALAEAFSRAGGPSVEG